jgi:hypothetical protein
MLQLKKKKLPKKFFDPVKNAVSNVEGAEQ